ncbi:MAG: Fic family protein [Flavobacterium lindanitolerans]|uniref:Fic family protein n=1 Tax=Flavobacterium lindanitolerans TaxID=428988 RepID=UPI001A5B49BD|nr:Fic family protein [Flavobacterium lindanitolerans]MBL7867167.1 Fic family protein [Flavobacterium lindanitolerans]
MAANIAPEGKSINHVMMVKDHNNALNYILETATLRKPITVELIRFINALVMKNTGSIYNTSLGEVNASNGEFRKGNVSAGGSYFPSYDKVERLLKELVLSLQETIQMISPTDTEKQLNLSFTAHYTLVSIHPFYDGNGRTSRLLMNYIQAYYGLPLGTVFLEDKQEYFTALRKSKSENSIDWISAFMHKEYEKSLC